MANDANGRLYGTRIAAVLSFALVVAISIVYTSVWPRGGSPIFFQNDRHFTEYSLSNTVISLYWIVTYTLSVGYMSTLFSTPTNTAEQQKQSILVAPHFISTNLLSVAFIYLWVYHHFNWALVVTIVQFFQLTIGYFRSPNLSNTVHVPVFALPLAFAFATLYFDGAIVDGYRAGRFSLRNPGIPYHTETRLVGSIFLWSWAVYGGFYLVVFKDWALGGALSVLTIGLAVRQHEIDRFPLQWKFAFAVMAILFVASLTVAIPGIVGGDPFKRGKVVNEDLEREPLLGADEA